MFSHIVLAWDESNAARHAADYTLALAERFGSRIDIVSVPAVGENSVLVGDLDTLRRRAERLGLKARVVVMPSDVKPEDGVLKHTQDSGADLIVVGHRTLGPVERRMVGSTSEKILRAAACAVLAVAGSE